MTGSPETAVPDGAARASPLPDSEVASAEQVFFAPLTRAFVNSLFDAPLTIQPLFNLLTNRGGSAVRLFREREY
jgi:hypothetical protein